MKSLTYLFMIIASLMSTAFADVLIPKDFLTQKLIFNSSILKSDGISNYSKAYSVSFYFYANQLILESDNKELHYQFDIISKNDEGYVVDFEKGLTSLNYQSSIYKTELDLGHPQLKRNIIPASYFKSFEIIDNSKTNLLAAVDLNVPGYVRVTFQISKDPAIDFTLKNHSKADQVGVYGTFPNINNEIFASKQSLPATYLYGENFPQDLIPSLKAAVQYWNKALGKELIFLKKASGKDQALKIGTNYIDYLSNRDDDGGARGIFSLNPENGHIVSSYIYVPSGFKVWGKKYFEEKFPSVNNSNLDQVVLDYLTHTLAHEIGHTLGLRHNFAASTQSNISSSRSFDALFKNYLTHLEIPSRVIPATSSMDYISIDYFAMIGAKMRLAQAPLSYDQAAVRWLYLDINPEEFGNFCTHYDEPPTVDQGGDIACQAWDEPHL